MKEITRIDIYSGRDNFTLPKTKVVWKRSGLIRKPVILKKFLMVDVDLVVEGPDESDVRDQVVVCLRSSAVKGILAGIVAGYASGGSAGVSTGLATFAASLDACMEESLQRELDISVELDTRTEWEKDWH